MQTITTQPDLISALKKHNGKTILSLIKDYGSANLVISLDENKEPFKWADVTCSEDCHNINESENLSKDEERLVYDLLSYLSAEIRKKERFCANFIES